MTAQAATTNDEMAQLPEFVGLLLLDEGESETFLGSTFPISEADGLYLGAAHTIPADRRDELSIAIQNTSGRLIVTKVLAVEVLEGQPDVVVLQAEDGKPPHLPLAAEPAFIWESVAAAGYPEGDIREVEPGIRIPGIRGLVGTVTRKVETGEDLGVTGPAYEVSFAIPAGMSGGPVLSMRLGYPLGLIGVCLGNVSATSYVSSEVEEIHGEEKVIRQETQKIEYGIVANLHRSAESRIALVDRSLAEVIGSQAATPDAHQMGRAAESQG
jgi:Trypsin-like peptidase domain